MSGIKNILIVHNQYQILGGEDVVVENERKLLEENGHEVFCYSRNNSELNSFSIARKLILPFSTIFNLKTFLEVKGLIKSYHIDVVHVHNTLNLISPSVYYAAFICNVPVVQTVHNFRFLCPGATLFRNGKICEDCLHYGLYSAIKHRCYRNSTIQTLACVISTKLYQLLGLYQKLNYICLTDFNKQKLLELPQIREECVYIKPNFTEKTVVNIIPYKNRKNRFIYAGRLDSSKGIAVLFEAWRIMGVDGPELTVCGTGPMESWCRAYIEFNSLMNVKLLGRVSNMNTKELIADSKALILPTRWYEGFPMTIVESYSVGTPVIGADIGNVGIIVEEGVTGWKFIPDSVVSLHNAVRRVEDISESVIRVFNERYTSECNYKVLRGIYEQVTSKHTIK